MLAGTDMVTKTCLLANSCTARSNTTCPPCMRLLACLLADSCPVCRGLALGFNMDLLDIGGGFCHQENGASSFASVAVAVNEGLAKHFPDQDAVRVIAEPGR